MTTAMKRIIQVIESRPSTIATVSARRPGPVRPRSSHLLARVQVGVDLGLPLPTGDRLQLVGRAGPARGICLSFRPAIQFRRLGLVHHAGLVGLGLTITLAELYRGIA